MFLCRVRCNSVKGVAPYHFIVRLSLLSASEFLLAEKWRCAKQKTTCCAGGATKCYTKKSPFHYNRVVQATIINERKGGFNGKSYKRNGTYKMDV